jgi:hypothetical protein
MILLCTMMGIALALILECIHHLNHLIEELGILMLHELPQNVDHFFQEKDNYKTLLIDASY